ncbi:MAG TPA: manganese catalase family protein [Solirubrobacterales bacterium]|nr:manganese catalase family protein [Solirubrobacterales bacterium]
MGGRSVFKHTKQLAYKVRVDKPNPVFAKMLQQAIGGVEGEIRVCLQYLFQGWNFRGPTRYKDMLLNTGTEEIGHIEMLATAVALNLEEAPASLQEEIAGQNGTVAAVLGGQDPRHVISSGLGAMPADANGNPFDGSWVLATGNLAADMNANVNAEGGGRLLATRLYEMTDDPGMKDMLSFLIARDTMHQNQWMAVLEELKDMGMPVPSDFPQDQEKREFSYDFFVHSDGEVPDDARWTSGSSVDSHGKFGVREAEAMGDVPELAPAEARPELHSAVEQAKGGKLRKMKDAVTP